MHVKLLDDDDQEITEPSGIGSFTIEDQECSRFWAKSVPRLFRIANITARTFRTTGLLVLQESALSASTI